jgi:DNA-binding CsgD family transcriptional regulator
MLRRIACVARPFEQADSPAEVVDALRAVCDPVGIHGICCPPLGLQGEGVAFYPSAAPDLVRDWNSEYLRHGPSLLGRYAQAQNPPPFTMVEALRLLQPSGGDRWLPDLLRDHRVRDSLWCAHEPWLVIYLSKRPLTRETLPDETRAALDAAAVIAVCRLKELAVRAKADAPPELSARQKTVLLHLSAGLTVPEIAARLGIAETSVKMFIQRAARKLGAKSQLHAVAIALRERLI